MSIHKSSQKRNDNATRKITSLFRDFKVSTEQELQNKLYKDSETLPCTCCGKEFPISKLHSIDCNPYCHNCLYGC